MRLFRITYRGIALTVVVLTGVFITALFQRGELPPRGLSSSMTCWWHRTFARVLGVRITIEGCPNNEATLFLSNHVSWFDITALGGVLPSHFLSKAEVRRWPIAGWLATRAGTLYIRRGGASASAEANHAMAEVLNRRHNVVLFPEGTTTSGRVRKFHSRLIQSAIDSGAPVQPVAIHYPKPTSGAHARGNHSMHPDALFIDDMSFGESLLRMLSARDIETRIVFCEAIQTRDRGRDELARQAEEAVRKALGLQEQSAG